MAGKQRRQQAIEQPRVDASGADLRMPHQRAQERDVGHDAEDGELAERAVGARQRGGAGLRAHDQLGQQRVVVDADRVALAEALSTRMPGPRGSR